MHSTKAPLGEQHRRAGQAERARSRQVRQVVEGARCPVAGMQKLLTRIDACGRPSLLSAARLPHLLDRLGGRLPEGARR